MNTEQVSLIVIRLIHRASKVCYAA